MRNPFKSNLAAPSPLFGKGGKSADPFLAQAPAPVSFRKVMDRSISEAKNPQTRERNESTRNLIFGKPGAPAKPLKERWNDFKTDGVRIGLKYERSGERVEQWLALRERYHPTHPRTSAGKTKSADHNKQSVLSRLRQQIKPKDRDRDF